MDRHYGRPRSYAWTRRRRTGRGADSGLRPDRVAAWAVGLGIFLILVASATSQGWTGGATAPLNGASGGASLPNDEPAASAGDKNGRTLDRATAANLARLEDKLGLPGLGSRAGSGLDAPARRAIAARMPLARATWFGPGLYGRRTACGQRLAPTTVGVAHRALRCGTPVTFYHRGRLTTVPVIDRGPFAGGVSWDLTAATARRLGFRGTGTLRVIH